MRLSRSGSNGDNPGDLCQARGRQQPCFTFIVCWDRPICWSHFCPPPRAVLPLHLARRSHYLAAVPAVAHDAVMLADAFPPCLLLFHEAEARRDEKETQVQPCDKPTLISLSRPQARSLQLELLSLAVELNQANPSSTAPIRWQRRQTRTPRRAGAGAGGHWALGDAG